MQFATDAAEARRPIPNGNEHFDEAFDPRVG
jgi:hypothetical protein